MKKKNIKAFVTLEIKSEHTTVIDTLFRKLRRSKVSMSIFFKEYDIVEMTIHFPNDVEMSRCIDMIRFITNSEVIDIPHDAIESLHLDTGYTFDDML